MPTTAEAGSGTPQPEPTGPTEPADPAFDVDAPDPGGRRHFGLGLTLITLAGLGWRLGYTLVAHGSDFQLFDEGDGFFYSSVARNLAAGHWYVNPFNGAPAADHPPLTVAVLAPASWIFRRSAHQAILSQRLTMTLIGTLVIVAVGLLGRYVAGDRVGLLAAAVAAVNPNLWMNDAVIMSESISALLIVGSLFLGYRLARNPSVGRAAAVGAAVGLTVLARAEIGLFLVLMVAPVLVASVRLTWLQRAGRFVLAAACMAAVIAPWALWNQTRFADDVPISTNDGTTLLGANCPAAWNTNITGGWSLGCVLRDDVKGLDASQASAQQRRKGIDYAKAHLGRLPVVLVAREGRTLGLWRPDQSVYINTGEGRPKWASWAGFYAFWVLVPVSVLGALGLRRRGVTLIPMAACLLTVLAVSGLFYGIPRFRLPLDLGTCLLAGVAVDDLIRRVAVRRCGTPAIADPAPSADVALDR